MEIKDSKNIKDNKEKVNEWETILFENVENN